MHIKLLFWMSVMVLLVLALTENVHALKCYTCELDTEDEAKKPHCYNGPVEGTCEIDAAEEPRCVSIALEGETVQKGCVGKVFWERSTADPDGCKRMFWDYLNYGFNGDGTGRSSSMGRVLTIKRDKSYDVCLCEGDNCNKDTECECPNPTGPIPRPTRTTTTTTRSPKKQPYPAKGNDIDEASGSSMTFAGKIHSIMMTMGFGMAIRRIYLF